MRRILFVLSVIVTMPLGAQQPARWLATWAPSPFAAPPKPPPDSVDRVPTYVDRTIRQIVRTTLGGDRLRIRFTNEYGERPLVIGAAHVAVRDTGRGQCENHRQAEGAQRGHGAGPFQMCAEWV